MKKLFLFSMLVSLWIGCNDSEDLQPGTVGDLSASAKDFIRLQSGSQLAQANGSMATLNSSAKSMASILGGANVNSAGSLIFAGDSTLWEDCGIFTQVTNNDGSTTTTIDYGDGCTYEYGDYSFTQFGKSISTYSYSNTQEGSTFINTFSNLSEFKDFGGKYILSNSTSEWRSNGKTSSEGQFSFDTAKSGYTGWYTSTDSSTYSYDGKAYAYEGSQRSRYENTKMIMESQTYRYTIGSNYFKSEVIEPLVIDYGCQATIMTADEVTIPIFSSPVSGRIRVSYSQDGKLGSFEVDYGDGTCDGRFIIIENGKIIEIDEDDMFAMLTKTGS
jgi:hypothetical protein